MEYPTLTLNQAEFTPRLAEAAAIAGEALSSGLVDCFIDVAVSNGYPSQEHNRVVMHTTDAPGFRTESFILEAGNRVTGVTGVTCDTKVVDYSSGVKAITRVRLLPHPSQPDQVSLVTFVGSENSFRIAGEKDVTLQAIPDMAAQVSASAGRLGDPLPWSLDGQSWGDLLVVSANRIVPVAGTLVQAIGSFAAKELSEGWSVSARLAVDVGSSGRVYATTSTSEKQSITLATVNRNTQTGGNFTMTLRHGGFAEGQEVTFVKANLRLEDRSSEGTVTTDTLVQKGDKLWRVRRQKVGDGDAVELGEYQANNLTFLDMAQAAITASDVFDG